MLQTSLLSEEGQNELKFLELAVTRTTAQSKVEENLGPTCRLIALAASVIMSAFLKPSIANPTGFKPEPLSCQNPKTQNQ